MAKRFLSPLFTPASIADSAGFRLPHGTAPSAPADGDVWTTTAGMYVRVNGSTVGPLGAAGGSYVDLTTDQTIAGHKTFASATTTQVTIGGGTTDSYINVTSPAGEERYIRFQTAGVTRWTFGATPAAEGGSNAGSDFSVARWTDAGAWIDNPLTITRSTGVITTGTPLVTAASTTAGAGLRVPPGTAPSAPTNGDVWTTTGGTFVRINGATKTLADLETAQTITGAKTFTAATLTHQPSSGNATLAVTTGNAVASVAITSDGNGTFNSTVGNNTSFPLFYLERRKTSIGSPTNVALDDVLGAINFTGWGGGGARSGASIYALAEETFSSTTASSRLEFRTSSSGVTTPVVKLTVAPGSITASVPVITTASIASRAGFRIPAGTAPSSPVDGDMWTTTAGLYVRINGSTVGPLGGGSFVDLTTDQTVGGVKTFSSQIIAPAATTSIPSVRMPHGSAPTAPTNGDFWTTTVAPFVRINGVTKSMIEKVIPFAKAGTLTTGAGASRFYVEEACTIKRVRASVNTAPTGASIIVDINKNGTTIFTTQGNRPTIAVSGFTSGAVSNMDVTSLDAGDYLTVDVDQIGSTIAGADLVVTIWVEG